jgi:hypothetical protein
MDAVSDRLGPSYSTTTCTLSVTFEWPGIGLSDEYVDAEEDAGIEYSSSPPVSK